MGYAYVKISDCCHMVSRGKTPRYDPNGSGKVVKSAHVQIEKVRWEDCPTVSDAFVEKYQDKFSLRNQDVLLNGTGTGTLGRPAYVSEKPEETFILDSHVNLFRVRESKLFYKYLFYWLLSPHCQRQIELSYTGSTNQIELSATRAGNLLVPLPPLDEQRRIAAILDKADAVRRKRKEAIALTEDLLRSAFLEMFGDPVINPKGWPEAIVGDLVSEVRDGPHVSPEYSDEGIPILSTRNIRPYKLVMEDVKYVSEDGYQYLTRKFRPQHGDVLLTKGGTTGYAKSVDWTWPFAVWVHLAVLRPMNGILPDFLEGALNSPNCYIQSQNYTRGIANKDLGFNGTDLIRIKQPAWL